MNKLHFYLLLAVVATTLTSFFLVNSLLIMALVGCRLMYGRGPGTALRSAFSSPAFCAFFITFLIGTSGFFHTHDPGLVWMHVQRKATLVAIPFVIVAGSFTDGAGFGKFMRAYCLLVSGLSCWCLVVAFTHYRITGDNQVFFYHPLTETLGVNAVYFSAYLLMALIFLFSDAAPAGRVWALMGCFLTAMMILLASKLLLVALVILAAVYLWRHRVRMTRRCVFELALLLILGCGMLAFTKNPVARRYQEILFLKRSSSAGFDGVSLRLFMWHSAEGILRQHHALFFGVSAGDSQDLLNQRYLDAGMSVGYLHYNFHNEFVEVLVDDGLMGLAIFLIALTVLGWERMRTMENAAVFLVILALACTESTLEMQHSLFLTCFFVMLPWRPKNEQIMRNLR